MKAKNKRKFFVLLLKFKILRWLKSYGDFFSIENQRWNAKQKFFFKMKLKTSDFTILLYNC